MRKFLLFVLILALISLFGCDGEKTDQDQTTTTGEKKITLTVWHTYNPEESAKFQELVDKYIETHPNMEIKIQGIPWEGHQPKILTAIATKETPDII